MRGVARRIIFLLWFGLACGSAAARAPDAQDDWPAGTAVSPPLWLQLAGPEAYAAREVMTRWLPGVQGQRPYPPDGLALGLLAPVPDTSDRLVWTVLQPALPMASSQAWPAQVHRRRLLLLGGIQAWQDDQHLSSPAASGWQPGHPVTLQLQLPLPTQVAGSDWHQASLTLALSQRPAQPPVAQLAALPPQPACQQAADCLMARLAPQTPVQTLPTSVTADGLRLDLTAWLAARPASTTALVSVQLSLDALQPDQVGRLQDLAGALPQWQLAWQADAVELSAEAMLRRSLDSLLLLPLVALPTLPGPAGPEAVAALPRAMTLADVAAPPGGCGQAGLSPEPAQLSAAALDRWRDLALAPAVREAARHRLLRDGLTPRDLVTQLTPRPGRGLWPGNLLACREGTACEVMADLQGQLAAAVGSLPWLSDEGVPAGQRLQSGLSLPLVAAGGELTEVPLLPGETQGHLLWQRSDGVLLLLSDDSLQPRWAWLPAQLRAYRQAWQDDAASQQPAWPDLPWQIACWQDASGRWHRQAFGLLRGQVWRLDLDDVQQPVLGWRPVTSEAAVGSLTLLMIQPQDSGIAQPVLLQAAKAGEAAVALMLRDGLSGEPIWRAGAQAMTGLQRVDAGLTAGWSSSWSRLPATTSTLHYGVDDSSQLWRLTLDAHPPALYLAVTDLRRVAALADPAQPPRPAGLAPSLAWLRHPVSGARVPGVLTLQREAEAQETLLLVLDAAGEVLQRSQLAIWPASEALPPDTTVGWQRPWARAGERALGLPRWLHNQIHVATTAPAVSSGCAPALRQPRLYRLPWRRGVSQSGAADASQGSSEGVIERPLAGPVNDEPVLDAAGQVRWSATDPAAVIPGTTLTSSRRRISRERLPP